MIRVLIAGDFCPRDRVLKRIINDEGDTVLSKVQPYIKESDLAIVNLECPVVRGDASPIFKQGPTLKCPEKSIDLIKQAGFNLVTLANNHFYDHGEIGVSDTLVTLDSRGIEYVGGGRNAEEAKQIYFFENACKRIAVINCCEHEFSIATDRKSGSNPLNPMAQWYHIQEARKLADYVIVITHGGHEQFQLPSPRMKETYRFFIDAGADAVINHHQHCYSGYEVYREKPIFYGIGNFCMDDPRYRNSKWNEGYMVQLLFNETISFIIIPYIQGDASEDVQPMIKEQNDIFLHNIDTLNDIIADDAKLNEAYTLWVEKTSSSFPLALMPYTNKFLTYLAIKGILPSKPSKRRLISILNKIECESHRDRFLFMLKKSI